MLFVFVHLCHTAFSQGSRLYIHPAYSLKFLMHYISLLTDEGQPKLVQLNGIFPTLFRVIPYQLNHGMQPTDSDFHEIWYTWFVYIYNDWFKISDLYLKPFQN